MKYKVKSQLYADAEAQLKGSKQILDDCTWSSCAAAVSWASGYTVDYTAAQGVAAFEKATGRKDKQGVSDAGGSLKEAAQTIAVLGGKARYAKSWEDAVAAAKGGAALMVWVQQPINYPAGVKISAWHDRWNKWWTKTDPSHIKAGYGHMTSAGYDEVDGWQWACPTRDEKVAAEKYGVQVTEAQLRQIAGSKVAAKKVAVDYKCLLIVTYPTRGRVDAPATPVRVPEVREVQPLTASTTPAPEAPKIAVEAPRKAVEAPKEQKATKTPGLDIDLSAFDDVDWERVGKEAINTLGQAAEASKKEKGMWNKFSTSVKWIIANTGIDEMMLEAFRTFLATSIAVALGLGIPLLDIQGGDFRTVLSAGLAACLQVIVRALNPEDAKFGVGKVQKARAEEDK
jgi:hypothetical protein